MGIKQEDLQNVEQIIKVTAEAVGLLSTLAFSIKKLVASSSELDTATKDQFIAKIDECLANVKYMPSADEVVPNS